MIAKAGGLWRSPASGAYGTMNEFRASAVACLAAQAQLILEGTQAGITIMGFGTRPPSPPQMQMAVSLVANLKQFCAETELMESLQQVSLAEFHLVQNADQLTLQTLHSEVRRIQETLLVELRKRKFLFISTDRTDLFENENSFGASIIRRFPLAKDDIVAAGNCLCAECYTASVFHLMRVFEWALRRFCDELGFKRMRDFDKKSGKFKYSPTSFAVWDKILGQLAKKVEKRVAGLRPSSKRQKLQEYYNSVLEDIKFAKDAWRNHVMHTRRTYEREEAHEIYMRVKGMMQRMANGKAQSPRS